MSSQYISDCAAANRSPGEFFRTYRGMLVVSYCCPKHGFMGWNRPGTPIRCRECGRLLFGPIADLVFASIDEIKPLA